MDLDLTRSQHRAAKLSSHYRLRIKRKIRFRAFLAIHITKHKSTGAKKAGTNSIQARSSLWTWAQYRSFPLTLLSYPDAAKPKTNQQSSVTTSALRALLTVGPSKKLTKSLSSQKAQYWELVLVSQIGFLEWLGIREEVVLKLRTIPS
jgi:hypothetical protein